MLLLINLNGFSFLKEKVLCRLLCRSDEEMILPSVWDSDISRAPFFVQSIWIKSSMVRSENLLLLCLQSLSSQSDYYFFSLNYKFKIVFIESKSLTIRAQIYKRHLLDINIEEQENPVKFLVQPRELKPKYKQLQVTPVAVTNESLLIAFLKDNHCKVH
ncbi:unnamed protein product, partial [Vitis vinifera]|uniref:Uncharacterized protein n=1 Tax=Vitis vinifera TaxID=29760 RepID=E0CTQ3_VITVI